MSEGRAVQIIAVPGGYIVEWNELLKISEETPFKNEKGEKIKIMRYQTGKNQVAVRTSVDEAMKLMASLLLKRMEIKEEEQELMATLTGFVYDDNSVKGMDVGIEKQPKALSVEGPSYAMKS